MATQPQQQVSYQTIFIKFLTIGAISFGGGVIAYLRPMLVNQTKWMTEDEYLAALEIGQTMPGLNAINMSVLAGDRLHGPMGAFIAALGMLLPGATLVFLLGLAAESAHHATPLANAALRGIAAGATGLLFATALRTGRKQFGKTRDIVLMALTWGLMSLLKVKLLIILLTIGPIAVYLNRPRDHHPRAHHPREQHPQEPADHA